MPGHDPTFPRPGTDDLILRTRGLTRRFMGFTAVQDVDLQVRRGSIHALIGPNGAGKSTCFNLLTKFLEPSAGTIHYNGVDITHAAPAALAQRGMVRSFQISATFPALTALQNVRIALQRRSGASFCFWRSNRSLRALHPRAMELLEQVGLAAQAGVPASELSYGRCRALELATTLALEPELMLLDEPTQGMGHEDVEAVTTLIQRVAQGRTVLLVEHNMQVVSRIADTITVLQRGQVLAEGSYEAVSRDPRVVEAYMGGSTPVLGGAEEHGHG
ncbi:ABC transporter ATP-binding protein [Variovorax sp. JS1663]|uniref:ABC transporter ATP-binding protein n=1 Tax=Variovorax sp. JS1663 TaxID=1851577 RepID=UPI000B347FAC|nr:ABC transporter ATP-binding protein [Variovorax sp. JS1663]OUL99610.1 ABC transporter ATP-binding protein [Variovorax sp. JS1663]